MHISIGWFIFDSACWALTGWNLHSIYTNIKKIRRLKKELQNV